VGLAAIAAGAAMAVAGWRAYSGRWRRWLAYGGLVPGIRSYPGLGLLYGGIGFMLAPLAAWAAENGAPDAVTAAALLPAVAGILISLLSIVWLPRFMRPAWVRTAEHEEPLRLQQKGRR
jgi:hypothetical protein